MNTTQQRLALCMATASILLLAACGSSNNPTAPTSPADIAGRITAVTPVGNYTGTFRVETDPLSQSGSPKAIATVNGNTIIFLLTRAEGDFRQLSVGQWVRVWFAGPVAESYPVQGTAATVVVDSSGVSIK